MVWVVEKKVIYHVFDLGFESVEIPVRVKFEFEVKEGALVSDSISKSILYNRPVLEKYYPSLDSARLQESIEKHVDREILHYLRTRGLIISPKRLNNTKKLL